MRDIRRILVGLDASSHSRAALKAAAELAAELHAELQGLFVEDINLLRLAELPGAEEIVSFSGSTRVLNTTSLERALRTQAQEVRRALVAAAEETDVSWSFRVARGRVVQALLAAAYEADMLVLGRAGRSAVRRAQFGSTAQAVAATVSRTVVFIEHGVSWGQPVLVLFDGTESGLRALATAMRLARVNASNLIVLIPSDDADICRRVQGQLENWLRDQRRQARVRCVALGRGATGLAHAVQREGARTVVLAADHPRAQEKTLSDLMSRIRCSLVLVR
jgi:nucleotide-binding universal stress UspA family protein